MNKASKCIKDVRGILNDIKDLDGPLGMYDFL